MPLNELSLAQLKELADDLASLAKVGQSLVSLNPVFDLTPGQPTRITCDPVMPKDANWQVPDYVQDETTEPLVEALARFDQNDEELYADHEMTKQRLRDLEQCVADLSAMAEANGLHLLPIPSTVAAPDLTQSGEAAPARAELVEPVPAKAGMDPPPAAGEDAGGTHSAKPSRSGGDADPPPSVAEASPPPLAKAAPPEADAESGGGVALPAADSAPAATHERTFTRGPSWTPEEDARLIEIIVQSVGMGATKKAGMIAAAKELGRPEAATQFRCHHSLKARIDTALTEAAKQRAQAEIPSLDLVRSPEEVADIESHVDAAVQAHQETLAVATADSVTAHLLALTNKGGWTVERDLELMELSIQGWPPHEIATQLQMPDKAIKPRFDMLTGLYDDEATGKKLRRFTRDDVFAALTRLAGKAA